MAAIIDWSGTNDWLKGLGDVVKNGAGIFKDISGVFEKTSSTAGTSPITPTQPTTSANVSASDLAFTPNWYLIAGGIGLLLLVLLVKK